MTTILTLRLDAVSQAYFNHLRELYYPPHLNQIPAHLTLFHTLPDTREIATILDDAARRPIFALRTTGLRSLGKGVAFTLASPDLLSLHAQLASDFAEHLSAQDRQRFQPHIVVQNKATPDAARMLLAELQRTFEPLELQALGLDLWHYLGGPWQLAETFLFSS